MKQNAKFDDEIKNLCRFIKDEGKTNFNKYLEDYKKSNISFNLFVLYVISPYEFEINNQFYDNEYQKIKLAFARLVKK